MSDFSIENLTTSITMHTATTPRLALHYRAHGDEDGVPMLLVHGSYATGRWWELFMRVLPIEIRAVAPDLRGGGSSGRNWASFAIDEQAVDLLSLVDALDWQECELVGHSSGGAIAMEFALTHPERIRTLTLVDSVPIEGIFTPLETYVLLDQMRSDRNLLAQALQTLMPTFDTSEEAAAAFFAQLVEDAAQMDRAAFTALADALNEWNRFGDSHNLRLPTLLVWGDGDQIVDRDATTRTLLAIPGANNLEVLRGVGHSPMIEAPVRLAERIVNFITEDFDDFAQVRRIATEQTLLDNGA
jgi:branched-chain amino acid transport system permease protein